jgi:S-DNA-T family DNA segregation ATPase FtsK/SpoIIIE
VRQTANKSRSSDSAKTKQVAEAAALKAEAQAQANKERQVRLGWDFAGLVLLALGALLLLAVLGITHGRFVDAGAAMLRRWFGYGRFIVAAAVFAAGWLLLLWRKNQARQVNIFRVILVEIAFFLLLGALSAFFNDTVSSVNAGMSAGGISGYGVAFPLISLITRVPSGIVLLILGLIALLFGLDLVGSLDRWARTKLGDTAQAVQPQSTVPVSQSAASGLNIQPKPTGQMPVRKPQGQAELPLQYRRHYTEIEEDEIQNPIKYHRAEGLPPLTLLENEKTVATNQATINMTAGLLEKTLTEFGVPAKVVGYRVGPTVTQYAVEPGYIERVGQEDKQKVRISKISALSKDLALALKAERLRIVAPVPGKSYVGVEVPNTEHMLVRLRPLLESEEFARINSPLAIPLGRGVSGEPVVSDLSTMPHLLIAGTTNSGKSICIAAITMSLVLNNHPDDLKMVMIDPKRVELKRFSGLPHLYGEVETEVERIMGVLRWATTEMENRYRLLESIRARNLDSYNAKMVKAGKSKLPRIVILIDELADLMLNSAEQTQDQIVRLAQKARAIGIHLVVATQRPSVDVVTGVIKANFPTRIAFTVASQVDSRVILDQPGAETLLGRGDMLFVHPETGLQRAQGVMITDGEIRSVIKWWTENTDNRHKQQLDQPVLEPVKPVPQPEATQIEVPVEEEAPWEEVIQKDQPEDSDETLINQAIDLVRRSRRASASYLQRHMRLGYPRAAWLIDQLEARGVLGPAQSGGKDREILLDPPEPEEEEE